ncbi:hypothetical protein [Helicobacter cinaedi]|uniref:hypothetical protein n=1 Tax=Helicobacter cinaedi TaxID=213 RepID=UPI0013159761|nr:hypothetical protein [Helicobacter cinaedi]
MQVWISAYARMRSRLVVVPLAPPYISFAIVSLTPYNALSGGTSCDLILWWQSRALPL